MGEPTAFGVDARMSTHEALCAERWNQIRGQMSEIKSALNNIRALTIAAGASLIAGMAGLLVTLLLHR